MPYVSTSDGAQIYFKDWGEGRPVLLAHGWPLNADSWEAQQHFLAERGFRVIAHDRRGHGRSSQTWHGNEMDTYADDLAALIAQLDVRDATLVGFSTGGGEVARYVGRHGTDRVAQLVLVSAVPPFMLQTDDNPDGVPVEVFDSIRASSLADRSQTYRELANGPFFGNNREGHPSQGMRDAFWMQGLQAGARNAYECIAAFSATDFRADLDKVDVPTLVIHGDDDQVVPFEVGGKKSAERIKGAQLKVYPVPHTASPTRTKSSSTTTCSIFSRSESPNRQESIMTTRPDTVVLVHGLWVTPRSWEHWVDRFESRGFTVLTPAYPGFEVEVEALRADPTIIAECDITETITHLADVVRSVATPPIIMGHSFGGALTQMLLARGLGAAGVAIDSAPTEGVLVNPPSQIRSLFPALNSPAKRHKAVGFTEKQFHYAFTNTLDEAAAKEAYDRYAIAAPGRWVWDYGLIANFKPGHQETWVDYDNDDRAPLLFIAGSEDHIMPPAVNKSNFKKYKRSASFTDYVLLEGRSHWTCAEPGWEDVADRSLDWAIEHARPGSTTQAETA